VSAPLSRRVAHKVVPGVRAKAERDTALTERDNARARVRMLEQQLAESRTRVGRLRERVDKLKVRDDLQYLFVMTYGRSGSTLLQGILNAIPGYVIRGENKQVLRHLYDFHRVMLKERRSQRRQRKQKNLPPEGSTPVNPFFGMDGVPRQATTRGVRKLAVDTLLRPEPDTRVVGYKEIRWEDDDLDEYVEWLREVFPDARFVVNTRNLDDVAQSKWWAEKPDARDHLEAVEARLLELAAELGDDAFRVHYDDYAEDPAALRPLFEWLGEPFDEGAIREVLDTPHSY
jgi:hypothetical protein